MIMPNIQPFGMKPLNKNCIQASNDMLSGKYYMMPFGIYHYGSNINWRVNPSYTRSYMRSLHGHFFISDLAEAYRQTQDIKYIQFGYRIIKDWIDNNPSKKPSNPMAWHDETTAQRLMIWILFFDQARKVLSTEDMQLLYTNIVSHAKLLASPSFYSSRTNHGMYQDASLLVFSEYFDKFSDSELYRNLAKKRIISYFDFIISKEGVHLEHSPSYHQYVAEMMLNLKNYFQSKHDDLGPYLSKLYERMALYATHVIKPDGKWPLISDTFKRNLPSKSLWKNNLFYQYAVCKGQKGLSPSAADIVFPEAGYAIFRDSWSSGEQGTYILFNAAYHVNYHKHNDDLSVWIYSNGDIISESGPNGYDMDNPYTQYAYSSFAHNTLIVDNKSLQRGDKKFKQTYLSDYKMGTDRSFATGINKRFDGVEHTRTVIYTRNHNQIQVTDTMKSKQKHNYKLLWHLAAGVSPEINKNKVTLIRHEKKVMELIISSSSPFKIQHIYGQTKPILLGWFMGEWNKQRIPIHALVIEVESTTAELSSYFQIL